jgi:hypothetical protein
MKAKEFVLIKSLTFLFIVSALSCNNIKKEKPTTASETVFTNVLEDGTFNAHNTKTAIQIDGLSKDSIWSKVNWYEMNYLWMGNKVDSTDYNGRFKLCWNSQYLYILVEVKDEKLVPTLANGLENYWKGDYVEVFIDEDKSGGDHKYNHQAFAYHVSTEGHVIDKNTLQETVFFDDHIKVVRSQYGSTHLWEMAIKLFDKKFDENTKDNKPIKIFAQKSIGFSIAYGDNDGQNKRENFMGSKKTHGNNNDEGYINSDVFGKILFIE